MRRTRRRTEGDFWMELIDRKKLARIMAIQGVSQRQVCDFVGWSSRGNLIALLNGTKKTLTEARAVRIAQFLEVPLDSLFVHSSSKNRARIGQSERVA